MYMYLTIHRIPKCLWNGMVEMFQIQSIINSRCYNDNKWCAFAFSFLFLVVVLMYVNNSGIRGRNTSGCLTNLPLFTWVKYAVIGIDPFTYKMLSL